MAISSKNSFFLKSVLIFSLSFFCLQTANADALPTTASNLPGSVLPERASQAAAPQVTDNVKPLPPEAVPQAPATNPMGAEAGKVKFKLTKLILKGNHIFSEEQLSPLFKDKLNTLITVAELQNIVQSITNYYRNAGYILTRAVLPPQHVAEGIVFIQIVEGYISQANVTGVPKGAQALVQAYGDKIARTRPLQVKVMEHYLLLANEIPGVQVKAVLAPSKTEQGASELNLVTQSKQFSGYVSYDNYGTRYIGPNEMTAGAEGDSIFRSGDSTQFTFSAATRPQELKFIQLTHATPLGTNGSRLILSANQALTRPGFILTPTKVDGTSHTFSGTVQYPMLRTRSQNMTLDAAFTYADSSVVTLPQSAPLYTDHVRSIKVGGSYDFADKYRGSNSAQAHVEQGLNILGATSVHSGNIPNETSRFGASGKFTKFMASLSRVQQFGASRFSAFAVVSGQFSNMPLLSSQQFGFGGVQSGLGRGYDSAEIIGDKGLVGSIELRMNLVPDKFILKAAQMYVFYDAGMVYNNKNITGQQTKLSATSAGAGSRFFFTKNFSGNLLFAKPLTKSVSALDVINNGRRPRVFFSLTASG